MLEVQLFEPKENCAGLQTEVTTLSQQVGLYDHRRAIMTAENVLLKQKLAALGQTQRSKEGVSLFGDASKWS
jgi:hypothetical protein